MDVRDFGGTKIPLKSYRQVMEYISNLLHGEQGPPHDYPEDQPPPNIPPGAGPIPEHPYPGPIPEHPYPDSM